MTTSDNPASRLHDLLEAFDSHAHKQLSVTEAWAKALEVEPAEAPRAAARASNLLNEVEQAVTYLNQPKQESLVARFLPRWSRPFFPLDRAWSSGSNGLVDPDSLATLGALGATMSSLAPEGIVPDDAVVKGVREAVQGAIDAVLADTDLDNSLRSLIVHRLYDVLWALDTLNVAGPGGVSAACERLVGALLLREPDVQTRPSIVSKVLSVAFGGWRVFRAAPEAQKALESWKDVGGTVLDALPPGLG